MSELKWENCGTHEGNIDLRDEKGELLLCCETWMITQEQRNWIAASPELYEALKEADEMLDMPCGMTRPYAPCRNKRPDSRCYDVDRLCEACEAKEKRQAALRKAEGKE